MYADATGDAPATGPALAAAFGPGTDSSPNITGPTADSARDVTIHGNPGTAGVTDGGEVTVEWSVDNGTQEWDNYAIYGRDLTEAEVMRAAEAAQVGADFHVTVPTAALPTGFALVAEGAAFPHLARDLAAGVTVEYASPTFESGLLTISTYSADPELMSLIDYIAGGERTTVRGHDGVRGTVDYGEGVAWEEDGLIAVVQSDSGLAATTDLDAIIASLDINPAIDVIAARHGVANTPPEHLIRGGERVVATGPVGDDGVWVVGLTTAPGPLSLDIEGRRGNGDRVGGSYGSVEATGGQLDTWLTGGYAGGAVEVVLVRDSRISAVRLDLADGTSVDLLPGAPIPDGAGGYLLLRVFGVWLEPVVDVVDVVATDAAGAVVVHVEPH